MGKNTRVCCVVTAILNETKIKAFTLQNKYRLQHNKIRCPLKTEIIVIEMGVTAMNTRI